MREGMKSGGEWYEIRVGGLIDPQWADWFDGMQVRAGMPGETIIAGRVRDQAALRGLLNRIADLNLSILAVNPIDDETEGKGE